MPNMAIWKRTPNLTWEGYQVSLEGILDYEYKFKSSWKYHAVFYSPNYVTCKSDLLDVKN